ncbi:MAG: type I DNA topoisomerase [Candidatus Saccharibacteria bacterium]|nr:type I DNA topoisomerase [Candidatus Saccharibacteria bacterium]
MSKNLLIVESPAKAKTIEKYLGKDYHVLSSVGHIRKDTKVDVHNNFEVTYEIDPDHESIVSALKKAVKSVDTVWLATDEDREGESISWHLCEVLKLPKNTKRITFHEITKTALEEAIKNPRTVDMDMVSAQQARQTLDMLVGFDLSDIVRKKVPGAKSAGRVQSPALRLIVEREREIEKFDSKFSFKITGQFSPEKTPKKVFDAALDKVAPKSEADTEELLNSLKLAEFEVEKVEQSEGSKANPVPFTTAALQIEANARLGFSSKTTMNAAQALYQAGHITYHRTDSLNLSNQALASIANYIEKTYGKNYLQVRHFHTKDASAQEAHEAIRPSHIEVEEAGKNEYEKKLYKLIRTRTLATQMANAKVAKTTANIIPKVKGTSIAFKKDPLIFIAKGESVIFDGFLKVYGSSKDVLLPPLEEGTKLNMHDISARQTFSKPPARYTEGSLVKKLEELGIGRPSTYATIMNGIQIRGYALKGESEGEKREVEEIILHGSLPLKDPDAAPKSISKTTIEEKTGATKGKLIPTPVGELVSDFLTENFENIVDYEFTAGIEEKLDKIAEAKLTRLKMLKDFYGPFSEQVGSGALANRYNSATELGKDPKTGKPIYAKIGKNGGFIQLGDGEKETGEKPRFAPLPSGKTVKTVTLEDAIKQLSLPALPRVLGTAKDGTELIAASGPFGPYLKAGNYNIPLKKDDANQNPYKITLATASELYQNKIDSIIADWGEIKIIIGPYGPYIKGPAIKTTGSRRPRPNNAKIPDGTDPKKITLEQAKELLENKPKATSRHAPHKRKTKKTTSKKKK